MNIACIIVGIDGWEQYTLPLVRSLEKHEPSCVVTVVDNASNEPYHLEDDRVSCAIMQTERLCYSAAINRGKQYLDADWYIVLSNDVLCSGPFAHILEALDSDTVAGPLLKTISIEQVGQVHYIEGWCVCIPRAVWDALGGWDEGYQVSSYEDVDFSHRARQASFYLEQIDLPFVHLDQKQRFNLIPNYWDSEAHNRQRFIEKNTQGDTPRARIDDVFSKDTLTSHAFVLGDTPYQFVDYATSLTVPFVLRELATNAYGLNHRSFEDGSVILDIGANVGVVSIYLAKQLPRCTIYAYEPLPVNFENLIRNIELNGVDNVIPLPIAVTADGRNLMLHYNYDNLGGASGFMGQPPWNEFEVGSYTLAQVFESIGVDRIALLKMDVEGAEHEILASANGELSRVDFLTMEAHFTPKLRRQGHNEATLHRWLRPLIERNAVHVTWLEAGA